MTLSLTEPQCNTPWTTLRALPVLLWPKSGNDESPKRVYNPLHNQSSNVFQSPDSFDKNSSSDSVQLFCLGWLGETP